MLAPATTAISPTPVGKLPIVERLPAIPAAAGVVLVNTAPAAFEPTAASSFRTTGDSSPVIFGLTAGRAVAVYKPRKGGAIPTVPAAGVARFTLHHHERIPLNSLNFFAAATDRRDAYRSTTTTWAIWPDYPNLKIVIDQTNHPAILRRNR